ncbi:hypothetical protein BDZ89DRAFT_1046271 [Hymenopellis radicata]|nr:hypothetical protein BDZ89DRAFT_1046271 [Hymenopellis radicata]
MSSPAPVALPSPAAREHTSRSPTPTHADTPVDESQPATGVPRPSTPPSSGPSPMEDVQATPTQSESAVANYLTSPGHDALHAIVVPDLTPRRDASTRRSTTPTPRGTDSVIPSLATPAQNREARVPATPTSPGHDLAHAICIQESDSESTSAQQGSDSDDDDVVIVQGAHQSLAQVATQLTSAPQVAPGAISNGPALPAPHVAPAATANQPARWLSCVEHRQVPTEPLVANHAFTSARWYLVIRGTFVGVFPFSYWADIATKRVKHSACVSRTCLHSDAVDEFNIALAAGLVQIVALVSLPSIARRCPSPMPRIQVVLLDSDPESGSDLDAYYTASSQESFSGDEEFFALVRALSLSEDQQPSPPVIDSAPVPAPPPPACAPRPSTSGGGDSPADVTLYSMSQNGQTRLTPHWSEAAASQGSAEVHALRRRRKDRKVTKPIIVVFVGLQPGVYSNWKAAKPHCRNVSCCIYQGYASHTAAIAAFQYATDHHWVLAVQPNDSALFLETRRQLLSTSALPLPGLFAPNTLNQGLDRDAWFCVYVGVSPGIYRTQ